MRHDVPANELNEHTMSQNSVKASDLFVQALEHEGVEKIFGVPGEENLDLLESIRKASIELVLTRHEQSAAFMAATYGRLTGKVGVCLATLGPGATNLVTGSAYAYLGAMPMLMITGQKPIKSSKQGRFQIIDVVSMMKPITKYTAQVVEGYRIPSMIREAFRLALEERPGPVHLELPEDIAHEQVKEPHLFPINPTCRPQAPQNSIERAIDFIGKAKMPLVLIGAGANRQRVVEPIQRFVEKTGIPFCNTQMGKGVIGGHHPLYVGTAALSELDYLHCALDRADLIINIGHDVIEKPPFFMTHGGKKVIHINSFSAVVDDVYFPQLEVIGDIANTLNRLADICPPFPHHEFDYYMKIRDEIIHHLDKDKDDSRFPMIPQRIVGDVRDVMPEDGIITLDNGMYKIWFARNYRTYLPNTILLDNALATMGAGLPSAMMVAMENPDKRVMAICGDGGFMMNSQELETAVRLNLNLVILILKDDAYGMIRWKQAASDFKDYGLEFNNPDFVLYAKAYGAHGHRIESTQLFKHTMTQAFEQGGVHLIEVPIDYSENKKVLIDELQAKVCLI